MDITSWFQLALICLLGAMSPGPSLALVIGNTIAGGKPYGIATSLGHATGIGIWALLTAIGVAEVIVGKPGMLLALQSLGACLLAYIGFRSIFVKDHLKVRDTAMEITHPGTLLRGVGEGFLISLFNPKIAVFFLAIFSHFIRLDSGRIETVFIGITAGLIDAIWYIAVAMIIMAPGPAKIFHDRGVTLNRISGTVLILIALYLLFLMLQDLV